MMNMLSAIKEEPDEIWNNFAAKSEETETRYVSIPHKNYAGKI